LSSDARTRATAKIEVHAYEPETYEDSGGGTDLVEIHVTEAFHGDIEGEGVVRGEGGFTANLGEGADVTLDYWFE
jgi:hypothetical protein